MDVDMDTDPEKNTVHATETKFQTPFPFQVTATQSVRSGKDTVVIAPVGAGKSQIARLLLLDPSAPEDAMVIIVTPFENLQVVRYEGDNKAIYLNKKSETTQNMRDIAAKRYQRIYTTSTQLESLAFQKLFKNEKWSKKVIAIVVDDAHEVVEQRDLLRPYYRELAEFRHRKRDSIPLLVLSSTLPVHVYYSLADTLELNNPTIINIGCDRPNVSLSVREFEGTWADIKRQMPEVETLRTGDPATKLKKTIIYWNDPDRVMDTLYTLRRWLEPSGFSKYVHISHGDCSLGHYKVVEEEFRRDAFRVLITTDQPDIVSGARDVERVIQIKAGDSAGACMRHLCNAGRDGRMAEAVILCQKGLISKQPTSDEDDSRVMALLKAKRKMDWRRVSLLPNESVCFRARLLKVLEGPPSTIAIDDTTSACTGEPDPRCCSVCTPTLIPPKPPAPPPKVDTLPETRASEELKSNMRTAIEKCRRSLWQSEREKGLRTSASDILFLGHIEEAVDVGIRIGTETDPEVLEGRMQWIIREKRFFEPIMRAMTVCVEAWDARLAAEALGAEAADGQMQVDGAAMASNESANA